MFYLFILFFIIQVRNSQVILPEEANTSVWLSGSAYCNKDAYLTMKLGGPAINVKVTDILYDKYTDLQGFVGVLEPSKTIYLVFRGSSSLLNWVDDAEIRQVSYDTFPECNECKVHNGFYRSANAITTQYMDIMTRFPRYKVIVTGHSYGAAVAQLISMELLYHNITSIAYTFGQPRVGNSNYANFVNQKFKNLWRFTHNKDIVPHVPFMLYQHSCREIFQNSNGEYQYCSYVDGEDPTCANQYPLYKTNTEDHEIYLNHDMDCDTSTIH